LLQFKYKSDAFEHKKLGRFKMSALEKVCLGTYHHTSLVTLTSQKTLQDKHF
jgi:hypothetical protein